jgi:hypothetical protein
MFQPRPVHQAQNAGPNPPDYFGHGAQPARKPKADQTCPEIHLLSNFSSQKKKKIIIIIIIIINSIQL